MKAKFGLFIGICATLITPSSFASSLMTFTGSINNLYQGTSFSNAASGELLSHYTTAGIGIGQTVQFEAVVDFSRQGQMTNEDGSVTVFADVPLTRNCDTCYGYSGVSNDYAELISSSVDFSHSSYYSGQKSYNVATSNYYSGMASDSHSGLLQLGDYLSIDSNQFGSTSALVYNWSPSQQSYFLFDLYFDDGAGLVHARGNMRLVSSVESPAVPVPAAAWLMSSALLSLSAARRLKK